MRPWENAGLGPKCPLVSHLKPPGQLLPLSAQPQGHCLKVSRVPSGNGSERTAPTLHTHGPQALHLRERRGQGGEPGCLPGQHRGLGLPVGSAVLAEWGLFIPHTWEGVAVPRWPHRASQPGGTMHCSLSSGNQINIFSPQGPTMGLFHGQPPGTAFSLHLEERIPVPIGFAGNFLGLRVHLALPSTAWPLSRRW